MIMFIRKRLILFMIVFPIYLFGDEIIGEGLLGSDLFNFLTDQYKTSTVLSYDKARDTMYLHIDRVNGQVECIYTEYSMSLPDGVDPSTHLYNNGSGIDCEHLFPQSMYDNDAEQGNPMKSDMHHLRPSKGNVNSSRGNKPYGEVNDYDTDTWYWLSYQQSSIPTSNIDRYSESESSFFEPREDVKGDIARSIFYFFTIYEDASNESFFNTQLDNLRLWNTNDPPTQLELERTWKIAAYQDNIPNPYVIDYSLVDRVFFPDEIIISGDINNDNILNVLDVVIVIGMIISEQQPNESDLNIIDINNDGVLNVLDAVILINLILSEG